MAARVRTLCDVIARTTYVRACIKIATHFMCANYWEYMYVYEPLEGVYTHLYGTKKGWAVPLDIHFHWNRTFRSVSCVLQVALLCNN